MRKFITAAFFVIFTVSQASAEVGINVGISGNAGLFAASAKEVADETHKGSEHGEAAWPSIFIEKTLGDRFAIGGDYVPAALETGTVETSKQDKDGSATATSRRAWTAGLRQRKASPVALGIDESESIRSACKS